VDDPGQPVDAVGRQAFTNRLDHRDAASHSGFKGNDYALVTGAGEDLVTVHGDQRLVGGHHMLAVVDGFEHQLFGNGVAADQLDDDVDLRVANQRQHIVGQRHAGGIALRIGLARSDLDHFNAATHTPGNFPGITLEHIEGAAADGPQSTDAYFHRFH